MTRRGFVLAVSGLAVLAGAGIAIIAAAFLGGSARQPETQAAAVVPTFTSTVVPATPTATAEPQAPKPPTPTTIGAGVKPTLAPTVPRPTATPLPPEPPGGGGAGGEGSKATPTQTLTPALPDLVVLDLVVSGDRVSAVIGNVGGQMVPGGTAIELALRGALAGSTTLSQGLVPGGSITLLLEQQYIEAPESVTALVDPNNLIAETNEANNGLTRYLEPAGKLDLALVGFGAVGGDQHLSVNVRNNSPVPARQVQARLTVYPAGSSTPVSSTTQQLSIEPGATVALELSVPVARGFSVKAVLELMGTEDGDPSNNTLEAPVQ